MRSYLEHVRPKTNEVLRFLGYKLVELTERFGRGDYLVSIVVWKDGGITIEDCARITYDLMPKLEADRNIPTTVRLEVSSPGMERKLKSLAEIAVFIGRAVTLTLEEKMVTGVIKGVLNEEVMLDTAGVETVIPLSHIKSARLVD